MSDTNINQYYPEEVPQMSTSTSVMLNITSNWVPFVGPIVSSIANSAYVGYTLFHLSTVHNITPLEILYKTFAANIGLQFDIGNAFQEAQDPVLIARKFQEKLSTLHIKSINFSRSK